MTVSVSRKKKTHLIGVLTLYLRSYVVTKVRERYGNPSVLLRIPCCRATPKHRRQVLQPSHLLYPTPARLPTGQRQEKQLQIGFLTSA